MFGFNDRHRPKLQLYHFHKRLNQTFQNTSALLNQALPFMQKILGLDRIYFFNWEKNRELLSLTMLCKDGYCMDMQETISSTGKQEIMADLLAKGYSLKSDLSYPAIYVFLQWKAPAAYGKNGGNSAMQEKFGVLRLERFNKSKKFSEKEIRLIKGLVSEISHNMINTEIDQDNSERLRLATTLNDLAAVFASSMRFNDAIEVILRGVQKTFKFDRVRMYLFDYEGANIRASLSTDIAGNVSRRDGNIDPAEIKNVSNMEESFSSRVLNLPLNVQGKGWVF